MQKKLLVMVTALCLVLSMGLLAGCNNNDPPAGGSWSASTKIYVGTMTAKLTFETADTWTVYVSGDSWGSGTYSFADKIGKSTLKMSIPADAEGDTKMSGVANGQEASFEPSSDGIYTIKIDFPSAKNTEFKLKPPQDGTKPGEKTPTECECTDASDCECDDCECKNCTPAEVSEMLSMTATESTFYSFPAKLTMYSDGTFKMEIAYYDIEGVDQFMTAATGNYAAVDVSNPMSALTLTYDAAYTTITGATDTLLIGMTADFVNIEYTVTIDYNTPAQGESPAMAMVFEFAQSVPMSA